MTAHVTSPNDQLASRKLAAQFNRSCFCLTLKRDEMADAIRDAVGDPAFFEAHVKSRPHLFSNVPVFLPLADRLAMFDIIQSIEAAAHTSTYRDEVLSWAPPESRRDFGPEGVFMGYDFHLGTGPPRLIEINTNAGGAFLNAFSARAQLACCDAVEPFLKNQPPDTFDGDDVLMFEAEWGKQHGSGRPTRIAIVDEAPDGQYLYPEFVLAKRLLQGAGIDAVICDPAALSFENGRLYLGERMIDMVYNRLVDFALSEPRHAALGETYQQDAVVVTPNPHIHALLRTSAI